MWRIGTAVAVVATVLSSISFGSAEFCDVHIIDPSGNVFVEVDGLETKKDLVCNAVKQMRDFDLSGERQRLLTILSPYRDTPPPPEFIIRLSLLYLERVMSHLRISNLGESTVEFRLGHWPVVELLKPIINDGTTRWNPYPSGAQRALPINSSEWVFYIKGEIYRFVASETTGFPIQHFYELFKSKEDRSKGSSVESKRSSVESKRSSGSSVESKGSSGKRKRTAKEERENFEWINVRDLLPDHADTFAMLDPTSSYSETTCLEEDQLEPWYDMAWPSAAQEAVKGTVKAWYRKAGLKPPVSPIVWDKLPSTEGIEAVALGVVRWSVFKVLHDEPVLLPEASSPVTTVRRRRPRASLNSPLKRD